jgi:hypothetical protein
MIEEAIVALLADLAPVYPAYLPERVDRPAIVYRRISTNRVLNHDGPVDLIEARIQITAHADTHPEALALARSIRSRIHGRTGGVGTDGIAIIAVDNELDLGWTPDAEGWEITLDAMVKAKE